MRKVGDVNILPCKCDTYLQFECERCKFYNELPRKEIFVLDLPTQNLILFDNVVTDLDYTTYVGYRS